MEQILRQQLLELANRYARSSSLTLSRIGLNAASDTSFFQRIRSGGGFTVKTFDRVVLWFSTHWPAGLAWPDNVERPEPKVINLSEVA